MSARSGGNAPKTPIRPKALSRAAIYLTARMGESYERRFFSCIYAIDKNLPIEYYSSV